MYDIGIPKDMVIRVYMLGNIVLMFAKMGFGFLFDRLGIRITYALCAVSGAIGLFILYLVTPGSSWALFPYIVISNFGYPLETVMIPLLVAELFGRKPFSHVMGYYLAFNYLGFATGSVISNLSYDARGTYRYMIFVLFVSMLVSSTVAEISMAIAKRDRKKFEAEEAANAEQAAVSEPAGRRDR
jgi:MFS family permease